jgi:hypothetical protein
MSLACSRLPCLQVHSPGESSGARSVPFAASEADSVLSSNPAALAQRKRESAVGQELHDVPGSARQTAFLPLSFEAMDRASSSDLAMLRHRWQSSEVTIVAPFIIEQKPTVAGSRRHKAHSGGTAVTSLNHLRGGTAEEAHTSFLISDSETIEAVSVTYSAPLVLETRDQATWVQQPRDSLLDEMLGPVWSRRNEQPILTASCSHVEHQSLAAHNTVLSASDTELLLVQPAHFKLELQGASAWAACVYFTLICTLLLVMLLWLVIAFVRTVASARAGGTDPQMSISSDDLFAQYAAKCSEKDSQHRVVEVHSDSEKITVPLLQV